MNKTTTISLGKLFFHIEEEAFRLLSEYLRNIKLYLSNEESREEIIADIEARIAELFMQHMKSDREVVSVADVNDVIAVMGNPEDYKVEDEEPTSYTPKKVMSSKRFFRDPDNFYLGGVCGGLAQYLSIQVVWMRVLWILFSFLTQGVFVLIYIILWIATPRAKTTADKLSMKGEPVNLDNIERKVKEDFKYAKEKVGDFAREHEPTTRKVVKESGEVLKNIGLIFLKIVGALLILFSSFSIIGLGIFFLSFGAFSSFDIFDMYSPDFFPFDAPEILQLILYCLISLVPLFILFQLGLFFLNPLKRSISKKLLLTNLVLLLISIATLSVLGVRLGMKEMHKGEVVTSEAFVVQPNDTISIQLKYNDEYNLDNDMSFKQTKFVKEGEELRYVSNQVSLRFKVSATDEFKVVWSKVASSYNIINASDNASLIDYEPVFFRGEGVEIPAYFTAPEKVAKNNLEVHAQLFIPEQVIFKLNSQLYNKLGYSDKVRFKALKNQYVRMNESKFECVSCEKEALNEEESNEEVSNIEYRIEK